MIRHLRTTILILSTLIVLAPIVSRAAGPPAGPFGFSWGAPPDKAPAQPIRTVDLTGPNRVKGWSPDSVDLYCARKTTSDYSTTPDGWKLTYEALKVDMSIRYELRENRAKFDPAMDGAVTAYIYKIPILEKEMEVCAIYFNNALFQISINEAQFSQGQSSQIDSAIRQKYGNGYSTCGSGACLSLWNDNANRVHISRVISTVGGLDYIYAPVKINQMRLWSQFYKKTLDSRSTKTQF